MCVDNAVDLSVACVDAVAFEQVLAYLAWPDACVGHLPDCVPSTVADVTSVVHLSALERLCIGRESNEVIVNVDLLGEQV